MEPINTNEKLTFCVTVGGFTFRYNGNIEKIEESIIGAAGKLMCESGKTAKRAFMSPANHKRLGRRLREDGFALKERPGKDGQMFEVIELFDQYGAIKCIPVLTFAENNILLTSYNEGERWEIGENFIEIVF